MSDFWSRRKAAVQQETEAEIAAEVAAEHEVEEQKLAERSDNEILAELDLPEPELLEDAGQVREFLNSAVPQRLKTRALRRLWRLNPVLANLDGLVDYGENFTDAATVVENLQTAYVVGKGMLTRFEEALTEEAEADTTEDLPATAKPDDDQPDQVETAYMQHGLVAERDAPDTDAMTAAAEETQETAEEPFAIHATSRRMRFHFETGQEV